MHAYTEYWHLRPFGVSCLLGVYDDDDTDQDMFDKDKKEKDEHKKDQ